jgi:hypothetical protein
MRIADRKRAKYEIVKEGEQRGVQAQAERNGPHHCQYKQRTAAESPQRVPDIPKRGLDQLRAADSPAFFLHRVNPAKPDARQPGCIRSRASVLPGRHFQVEAQFFVQLLLRAAA